MMDSRSRQLGTLLALTFLACVTAPPALAQAPNPEPDPKPKDPPLPLIVKLSDESSLTRWAYAARIVDVRSRHSTRSRRVGRLRFFTEDGFPEVYLALTSYTTVAGKEWLKIRVPKRPNGVTGWIPADALGELNENRYQLVINRSLLKATLFRRRERVWTARVGIGAPGTETPAGRFYVREKFRFSGVPVYGTHAIGTSAYAPTLSDWPGGGVIGIHGTSEPELIPGRPSHGCVRVRNPDVERLWRKIPIGTPIWIR